jgi:hypothetical protein
MDVSVDQELAEMELRIANPANRYTSTTNNVQQVQSVGGGGAASNGAGGGGNVPESDIDRQLRELEERLGKK